MKFFQFILVAFCLSSNLFAQVPDSIVKLRPYKLKNFGNNAIRQGDYLSALSFWQQYNKVKPGKAKAMYKLAECYKNTRDYAKAEEMYKKAYENSPSKNILALFYQAAMLKMIGDYDKAKERFTKFKKEYKGPNRMYKKMAQSEIKGCDTAKVLLNVPTQVFISHLDSGINKPHMEMSPISDGDSSFIFAALRTSKKVYETEGDTSSPVVRKFYKARKVNGKWEFNGELEGPFNSTQENSGNGSYSYDGKRFYFSRCKKNWKNEMVCAIYVSHLENGNWQEPILLTKPMNNAKYSYTQPAAAFDPVKQKEIVFFTSNLPKGKGGLDIWYSVYNEKSKSYKSPRNAGNKINSVGDEMTPFYDQDTRTLYFSSNGWNGLGGLDVFKIMGDPGKWAENANVGSPINSSADDIYYSVSKNREEGFFVSNRKGGFSLKNETCCDDIYTYKYKNYVHINLCGKVLENNESKTTGQVKVVEADVSLVMLDPRTNEELLIKTIQTNEQGLYCLKLEQGNKYKLLVKKEGYLLLKKDISTENITNSTDLNGEVAINKLPKGAIKIDNLYYDFNKSSLTEKSTRILDSVIYQLMINNPEIIIEISSHTDNKGDDNYNLKLSQKRAEAVVNHLVSKGIKKERLVAKGYGETMPIAPNTDASGNDNPEGREKNRRTEMKIIGQLTQDVLDESKNKDDED